MDWKKYQHIERLATDEVDGILNGEVYIFSKVDGTNTGIFLDNEGNVRVNSRNRLLAEGCDNAGSCAYVLAHEKFKNYLKKHPTHYLYGEFLVRHTIRTYEDDAWNKLYIFDVVEYDEEGVPHYLSYEEYAPLLDEFNIEYIPLIKKLVNPSVDEIMDLEDSCLFLQKEGCIGEGIVIKNYSFVNKYGRTTWAKVVRKQMQISHKINKPVEVGSIEQLAVDELCTAEFIEKEYAKIVNENDGAWSSKLIPKLIGTVWHTFVVEESWNIVKKYKNPKVDFKILNRLVTEKIKEVKKEVF